MRKIDQEHIEVFKGVVHTAFQLKFVFTLFEKKQTDWTQSLTVMPIDEPLFRLMTYL